MMKTTQRLYKTFQDTLKIGNHKVAKKDYGNIEEYYFYSTKIFEINKNTKTIILDNGGWNTTSTTRTINDYISLYMDFIIIQKYIVVDLRYSTKL